MASFLRSRNKVGFARKTRRRADGFFCFENTLSEKQMGAAFGRSARIQSDTRALPLCPLAG
jgi:hypothetical protein